MTRFLLLMLALGCATARDEQALHNLRTEDPQHPVFVGYTQSGEVVMATTHADAMRGLAVAAADVGAPVVNGDNFLICKKEMLTGTHVANWICRYPTEVEKQRIETQNFLQQPRSCVNCVSR